MHVAHSSTRQQLSLRAVFVLAGAALMIIVGLLGMHTFSIDPAGHATASTAHAVTTDTLAQSIAAPATDAHTSPCHEACTMGSGNGHSDMATACVLALLAGLLLLLRPLVLRRFGAPPQTLTSMLRTTVDRALSRAPSLTFLSISRT